MAQDNSPTVVFGKQKTKIETTYEYIDIIKGILGWWRQVHKQKVGVEYQLYVCAPDFRVGWDRFYINGHEIPIPGEVRESMNEQK